MLNRGHANVFGTVAGAIFVGVLLNGLTMLNVPYYTQDFVKGAVSSARGECCSPSASDH